MRSRLAAATGRSKSWHVNAALEAYVTAELEFVAAVEEGLAAAERGELIPHEDVIAEIRARHGKISA